MPVESKVTVTSVSVPPALAPLIGARLSHGTSDGALHAGPLREPGRYLAVIAKGDEVLDWREMRARYAGGPIRLLEGGDHALTGFEQQIDEVLNFLDLA